LDPAFVTPQTQGRQLPLLTSLQCWVPGAELAEARGWAGLPGPSKPSVRAAEPEGASGSALR